MNAFELFHESQKMAVHSVVHAMRGSVTAGWTPS